MKELKNFIKRYIHPGRYFNNPNIDDWLYINAVFQNKELLNELIKYDAFTDIEFNPNKSFNCQARSAAIVVSLWKNNMLNYVVQSVDNYKNIVINKKNNINNEAEIEQLTLF